MRLSREDITTQFGIINNAIKLLQHNQSGMHKTGGGSSDLISDTSPQLGGDLDVSGHDIVTTSNADIDLDPHERGSVVFKGNTTRGSGSFKLNCENNSHGITIKGPPHSVAASYTLTLPNNDGDADQVLKTNGLGTLAWVDLRSPPPTFSSLDYPGSTALDPLGGQNLVINGSGFVVGINVKVGGTNATSVTVNAAHQITIGTPPKSPGTYALELTNTDGGNATAYSAVSYNGVPVFTHAAGSLGTFKQGETVNVSVVATESDGGSIIHTVSAGSLPLGLSFNATTGAITGTAPDVTASTTTTFTITATDNESQFTSRVYSIQVDPILPSDDFNILTYTGNAGTQTITGLSFQPDFVWLKRRDGNAEQMLMHPNIGIGEYYRPSYSSQGRLTRNDVITSLNSNGFSLGGESITNSNNDKFVAYCWKVNGGTTVSITDGGNTSTVQVNADKGISMITYSGTGANRTVGHGLGKVPHLFFMMDRYNGGGWRMWHRDLDWSNKYLEMGTGGQQTSSDIWQNTFPTSTVFTLGNVVPPNGSGRAHVCWAFTSIDKHSKFSSYIGNGSHGGPIVELGFKPALLIIRRIDSGDNFYMFDNKRETENPRNVALFMNSSSQEATGNLGTGVDFLSNGFQVTSTDSGLNSNNGKYIYMAWAANQDTVVPTLAKSFNAVTYTGNGYANRTVSGVNFRSNLIWLKAWTTTEQHYIFDSIRGASSYVHPNLDAAAGSDTSTRLKEFNADGFVIGNELSVNQSGASFIAWVWKANDDEPTIKESYSDLDAIAIYKFEDNVSDVTTNHNGTDGGISYNGSGKFNKSAVFNGSSSKVTIPSLSSMFGSKATFSVSLWFKTTATGNKALFDDYTSQNYNIQLYLYYGKLNVAVRFNNVDGNMTQTSSTYNDGNWHHVVITSNKKTYCTYIDGSKFRSWPVPGQSYSGGSPTVTIGASQGGAVNFWNGEIDHVRIYNQAITPASVTILYGENILQNSTLNIGTQYASSIQSIVSVNDNAGFSIVRFTNETPGPDVRVAHGLSAAPNMILLKRIDGTENWYVYHSAMGTTKHMRLDTTAGEAAGTNLFNTVNSTVFNPSFTNATDQVCIAYCFRDISGHQKFGSYTGNAPLVNTINTGFRPDFVLIKRSNNAGNWLIFDSKRPGKILFANDSALQQDFNFVNFYGSGSTAGFEILVNATASGDTNINLNNDTYIYMAFKIN